MARHWVRAKVLFVCLGLLWPAPAAAQSIPPQEPILRIDPGMHLARIWRIGVDAACTLLATGSDDKTVRLWRLPEGKLLRTLQPPIGPSGHDGKVFAVAVAPNGSWVATGGFARYVYIFDPSTGAMVARLGSLNAVTRHLAVSSDGRYLAAVLAAGHGLRVWESTDASPASWRLVADDRNYGGQDAYGAAFDRAGTLYTVAYDGKLRRYAPGFQGVPNSVATRGGA